MPKRRTKMDTIREILRLYFELNFSIRRVSEATRVSKTTVGEYIAEFKRTGFDYEDIKEMDDVKVFKLFEKSKKASNPMYEDLSKNFQDYEKELKRTGVTLYHLWQEYKEQRVDGFSYSRFCFHYKMWLKKQKPDMHFDHKAGDKMYVDFTGKKMEVTDRITGEIRKVEVFLSILGASQYTYVESSDSQRKEDWIRLNENAFLFYGGVTNAIVPDNLKSGVTKACKYEPLINETYYDFARHYNTSILPTRPSKPKDKPLCENAVNLIYQRVFAPLRNEIFFSVQELNEAMWKELEKHNNTPFQKRDISRHQLFNQVEKQELKPLPAERYEIREYQLFKVQFNYHIYLKADKHYYSVPWQYVGKEVKIIYTSTIVEIYKNNIRFALHPRNRSKYKYTTNKEHMPPNHQFVNGWSSKRFINWAAKIGEDVKEFIELVLDSREHPEQAFKACIGILKLGEKYEKETFKKVCRMAIKFNSPTYRFINNSLKNKTYNIEDEETNDLTLPFHENIRGKDFYK